MMRLNRLLIVAALPLLASCPPAEQRRLPPGPDDPVKNLAQWDAFADRVRREAMIAAWQSAIGPGVAVKAKSFGVLPLLLLPDREVDALRQQLADPRQTACLGAVHAVAVEMQSESDGEVAAALAAIGPLRTEIPDLSQLYTDEPDPGIRRARWLSQTETARKLAPRLRRLVIARNEWAGRRSHSAYLALMNQHRGYEPRTAARLEREVRDALASQQVPTTFPWEFEQSDPALAARMRERFDREHCLERASYVFSYLRLPATPASLEVHEVKQSPFSAFAFYAIDPPREQGITVAPGAGIAPHWSAFHEFGHAAMSLLVAPASSCRTFRRPVSRAVSEGCAKITERLFFSPEWLQRQSVPPRDIQSLGEWERRSELARMRSILADIELERALYADPRGNVMRRYIATERKTAGVEIPKDVPSWALKRHLAYEPLARVDYLLARCAQAAVYRRVRKLPGGLTGEEARTVMRHEVFEGATELRYEEWFRKATGSEPGCAAWIEDVAGIANAVP